MYLFWKDAQENETSDLRLEKNRNETLFGNEHLVCCLRVIQIEEILLAMTEIENAAWNTTRTRASNRHNRDIDG